MQCLEAIWADMAGCSKRRDASSSVHVQDECMCLFPVWPAKVCVTCEVSHVGSSSGGQTWAHLHSSAQVLGEGRHGDRWAWKSVWTMANAGVGVASTDSDHDVVLQGVEVDGVQSARRCSQPLHQATHAPCRCIPVVLDNVFSAVGNVLHPKPIASASQFVIS